MKTNFKKNKGVCSFSVGYEDKLELFPPELRKQAYGSGNYFLETTSYLAIFFLHYDQIFQAS